MRLLDLVEMKIDGQGDLWMFRSGPNAGMTSMVFAPQCWSFTLKNQRLSKDRLEEILYEAVQAGLLFPFGIAHAIACEQFTKLELEQDGWGKWNLVCNTRNQIHG